MPPGGKKADDSLGQAPLPDAAKDAHRKHAAKFLAMEDYKDPKKVNEPNYEDKTDKAKE